MKDPFQVAIEKQEQLEDDDDDYDSYIIDHSSDPLTIKPDVPNKDKDKDQNDEEVEISNLPSTADPSKMAQMQAVLSQFTEEQMSRYESFRRSGFQKASMRKLLTSVTGSQKVTLPVTITVCGIAKLFVGELVETARTVMAERNECGPIRPCHVREAFRRLKLEGKVPRRSVPRLFKK